MQEPVLSPTRVTLLRVLYLIIIVGNGLMTAPQLLMPATSIADSHSVVNSMLGALMCLSILGLRYPTAMLPVLFWELAWKCIWLFNFALRTWLDGGLDAYAQGVAVAVGFGLIVVPLLLPWPYIFRRYVSWPGEPWRNPPATPGGSTRSTVSPHSPRKTSQQAEGSHHG